MFRLLCLLTFITYHITSSVVASPDMESGDTKRQGASSGANIDPLTAEAIRGAVDASCSLEVEQFLAGELEQSSMSQECQKDMVDAYKNTPVGQLATREHQLLQQASFARMSSKCKGEFKTAKSEEDVSPECHEKMGKEFAALQQYVFQQTVRGFSESCKAEFEDLQKKPGTTGKDISPACMTELQALKPAALDIIEKQLQSQSEHGATDMGGGEQQDGQKMSAEAQQAAASEARRKKKAAQSGNSMESKISSSRWGFSDFMFLAVWLLGPVGIVAYVYNSKRDELDKKSGIEAKLENIQSEAERERKRKILLRREKEKKDKWDRRRAAKLDNKNG